MSFLFGREATGVGNYITKEKLMSLSRNYTLMHRPKLIINGNGKEEFYGNTYCCPHKGCKNTFIFKGSAFCYDCGKALIWPVDMTTIKGHKE
jgi:hypothetical protein